MNMKTKNLTYLFGIYGFILPTFNVTDSGVDSINNKNNMTAFVAAANPVLALKQGTAASTFQVAQSRFGFDFATDAQVKGILEFDLMDFTKSSATTTGFPRVRRALIEAPIGNGFTLEAGQDWDLFNGGVHPFTYNYVGHYFESGDSGFMRTQFVIKKQFESSSVSLSAGLPTANTTATENQVELSLIPVITAQAQWKMESIRFGITALGASTYTDSSATNKITSMGVALFEESSSKESGFSTRAKAYCGQNLANIAMLSLSFGRFGNDVYECGGYITPKYDLTPTTGLFVGAGAAYALNPSNVAAAYTQTGSTYSLSSTLPGIQGNVTARIGIDHEISPKVKIFSELAYLWTRHKLLANEVALGINSDTQAFVLQSGLMMTL